MGGVVSRRRFLQLAGGSVASTMLSDSIARALAIPANRATRSIKDIEHVVVLMQENRSFDHYFGVLRGVRGFGDPHPAILPSGRPVWYQADGATVVPPFRPEIGHDLALTFIEDLDHSWDGTHQMLNGGNWDQWLPAKTTTCMAHMERADLPFHYALADAFTVCDANFCSMLGPTDPNRYYMWTGWDGNDGKGGGPVIANDEIGYDWMTYPERLQQAESAGRSTRTAASGSTAPGSGAGRPTPTSATTATTRCSTSTSTRTPHRAARSTSARAPEPNVVKGGTGVNNGYGFFEILANDVKHRPAPERVVGRRSRGLHRAPGVARRLRRLVHGAGAQRPDQRSRRVVEDGAADHVRRERRLLRSRRVPLPERRRSRRPVDGAARQRILRRERRARRAARTGPRGRMALAFACRC